MYKENMEQNQQVQERKPPPPVEVSLNYLSWSVKDLVKVVQKLVEVQEQIANKLEGIEKAINLKDKPPF
jgi:hypothetical protein